MSFFLSSLLGLSCKNCKILKRELMNDFLKKTLISKLQYLGISDILTKEVRGGDFYFLIHTYKGVEFACQLGNVPSDCELEAFVEKAEKAIWKNCDKYFIAIFDENQPEQRIPKLLHDLGYLLSLQLHDYLVLNPEFIPKEIKSVWIIESINKLHSNSLSRKDIFTDIKNQFIESLETA